MSYDANTTASELVSNYADKIKGKTVLTTGASPGGLGGLFVEAIAKASPALLILAGRSLAKLQQTADAISAAQPAVRVRLLKIDLESFQSVQDAAATVNGWTDVPAIDVLVNNAGLMAVDYGVSSDGFERQFAANHLGPFLFTNLIMDKVLASPSPRIVNVSSDAHRLNPIRFADYNFDEGKSYNKWLSYGQSKTANMLMTLSLAEKLRSSGLLTFSLHPGVIGTNLGNHLDWDVDLPALRDADRAFGNAEGWLDFKFKDAERGIATHVYAAFEPALAGHNGAYLLDCHVGDPVTETVKPWATSPIEAEKLWNLSEKLVGMSFKY